MIIWIISAILLAFLITSLIVNRNLYIQNTKYEDLIEESSIKFFKTLDNVRNRVTDTYSYMKDIDQRQMFEKDDEVGMVFKEMFSIIEQLNKELKIYDDSEKED